MTPSRHSSTDGDAVHNMVFPRSSRILGALEQQHRPGIEIVTTEEFLLPLAGVLAPPTSARFTRSRRCLNILRANGSMNSSTRSTARRQRMAVQGPIASCFGIRTRGNRAGRCYEAPRNARPGKPSHDYNFAGAGNMGSTWTVILPREESEPDGEREVSEHSCSDRRERSGYSGDAGGNPGDQKGGRAPPPRQRTARKP